MTDMWHAIDSNTTYRTRQGEGNGEGLENEALAQRRGDCIRRPGIGPDSATYWYFWSWENYLTFLDLISLICWRRILSSINSPISALKKVCLFVCLFNHRRWYRRIGRILKIGDARIVYYVRTKDIIFKCFGEIALQIRQCLCVSVKETRRKRGSYFEGPWAPGSCPLPTSDIYFLWSHH